MRYLGILRPGPHWEALVSSVCSLHRHYQLHRLGATCFVDHYCGTKADLQLYVRWHVFSAGDKNGATLKIPLKPWGKKAVSS